MAYTEADTRAKFINLQIKSSDNLSSLIKLSGMDMRELKEVFALVGLMLVRDILGYRGRFIINEYEIKFL